RHIALVFVEGNHLSADPDPPGELGPRQAEGLPELLDAARLVFEGHGRECTDGLRPCQVPCRHVVFPHGQTVGGPTEGQRSIPHGSISRFPESPAGTGRPDADRALLQGRLERDVLREDRKRRAPPESACRPRAPPGPGRDDARGTTRHPPLRGESLAECLPGAPRAAPSDGDGDAGRRPLQLAQASPSPDRARVRAPHPLGVPEPTGGTPPIWRPGAPPYQTTGP